MVNCGGWSVGGRVCGILAVSRAFGDYEFKGGRFDLLEDLSEEPLAKKATLKDPPVVPTPACSSARSRTGERRVARRRERRPVGHGEQPAVRHVHQARAEEDAGDGRGRARERAGQEGDTVQDAGQRRGGCRRPSPSVTKRVKYPKRFERRAKKGVPFVDESY